MLGKTQYRHIEPSEYEEEIGERFIEYEVVVEQDDTLHEKRYVFEYIHLENMERFQDLSRDDYLAMCFRHKDIFNTKFELGKLTYLNNFQFQCTRKFTSVFFRNEFMKELLEVKKDEKNKK